MPGKGKPREGSRRPKREKDDKPWKKTKRKACVYCKEKIDYVDYKDVVSLRKFVSERGKIRARRVTGNCVQHQRDVATAVKNARQMALLPYAAQMKVILQKPVEKLGDPGDVVEVAAGYARNYLVPRGLAVRAEKGALKHAENLKRAHVSRQSKEKIEFEALAATLIASKVTIAARAGEEGKLFGSVTAADIAEAIAAQTGIEVDRKDVHLDEPIRSLGTHDVRVHLFPEVEPVLTIEVTAEE